jgi:hypothetical protein
MSSVLEVERKNARSEEKTESRKDLTQRPRRRSAEFTETERQRGLA